MAKVLQRIRYSEKRGEGALVLFDDSANWVSVYSHHGREHRESTKTSDLKQAKRAHKVTLDKLAAERQGHGPHVPAVQQRVTVGELLDAYERDIALRELKSAANQKFHVAPVRAAFGDWKAISVTSESIDKVVEQWKREQHASATINRRLQVLGAAFKIGKRTKRVQDVPLIRRLRESNVRQGFFEQSEFGKVLKHLPEYLTDLARFAYLTGWRRSEITGLQWSAVDLKAGQIRLPDSKNGRSRLIPIAGELVEILKRREAARLVTRPDGEPGIADHVFHRSGAPIKCFRGAWAKALTAAGFTAKAGGRVVALKKFHDMRRSAVRNLVRANVPQTVAMSITGHVTPSVFQRYDITSTEDQQDALERVSAKRRAAVR